MIMETISPDAAKELIVANEQASQKMFRDVQTDIGLMLLGNAPALVENDPTAPTRLQLAQQILQQNPKAQQALQGDQIFQQLFQQYVQNLQMSVQQEQNKQVGRTGVAPQGPNLADQVKSLIDSAKQANSSRQQGVSAGTDAVGDQVAQQRQAEAGQAEAQGQQSGQIEQMMAQLMEQGMSEEEAVATIQQQMGGGGGPPQGGPPQGSPPPEQGGQPPMM
jgi:hypothetical protein